MDFGNIYLRIFYPIYYPFSQRILESPDIIACTLNVGNTTPSFTEVEMKNQSI